MNPQKNGKTPKKMNDITTSEGIIIADHTTREEWVEIHRSIIQAKRYASKWLSQSRKWASERWGVDYVAETEVQLEMALGLPQPKEKPDCNGEGKAKGIVSVEGIAQSFSIWQRGVAHLIPRWDRSKIERALELLEPIEAQAKALRTRLDEL
jgi:hypothetical protein